jgi:hypothetical protein
MKTSDTKLTPVFARYAGYAMTPARCWNMVTTCEHTELTLQTLPNAKPYSVKSSVMLRSNALAGGANCLEPLV